MTTGDFTFAYLKYHLKKSNNYKQTYIKARGEINESFFITCTPKRETEVSSYSKKNLDKQENIKCVIFDCDGVLVDSETKGNKVLISIAKEFGFEMTIEDAYKNFNCRSLKDCFQQIEKIKAQKLPDSFKSEYRQKSFETFK
jgi:hypothetical protein